MVSHLPFPSRQLPPFKGENLMSYDSVQTLHVGLTSQETKALSQLLSAPMAQLDPSSAAFDLKAACKYYEGVKGILPIVKGLIGKIPTYGDKIVTLLGYLEMIADFSCPAQATAMRATAMHSFVQGGGVQIGRSTVQSTRLMNLVSVPMAAEATDYSSATITNGYGQIAKAGASVTRGAKVTIDVKITVQTVSQSDFKK